MKHMTLIHSFYSRMRLPCLLLFLLMTSSLLILTMGVGYYRYVTYSRTVMKDSGLDNAVYVSYLGVEDAPDTKGMMEEFRLVQDISYVENVMYAVDAGPIVCRDEGISLILLPDGVYTKMPFFLPKGELFSESGLTEDGQIQCVMGAPFLRDVKAGDSINLYDGVSGQAMEVYVSGKLPYPYFHPDLGSAGNISADAFVSSVQIILAKDTPQTRAVLETLPGIEYTSYSSYWVDFSDTATSAQKAAFIRQMQQGHRVASYEDIMKNTDSTVSEAASSGLATPLFLVFITTMSFISITVLLLYNKINQSAIWFLCGCSKRRSYVYASLAVGLICLAACLLPLLIIWLYPVWGEMELLPLHIYLDGLSVWIILGYLAATLVLAFGIPFALQYKTSPMDTLRRLDE